MKINLVAIINIFGVLFLFNATFMALCIPFAWYYQDNTMESWLYSVAVSTAIGMLLYGITARHPSRRNVRKRDGYIIVAFSWFIISLSGTSPYLLSGSIPDLTNAFFESISGFTTTGATILEDIEALPPSILFWRSLTQWIGGLGFIVLVISILPSLGIGGMQLFLAEAPGITADKIKPRIQDTAKRLWFLYIGLTLLLCVLLQAGGMGFFDALNHSLTTLATGGYSVKNASIGHYNSAYFEYIITLFMFMGGTSFVLLYLGLKGKFNKVWKNEEFRAYLFLVIGVSLIVTLLLMFQHNYHIEEAFRKSAFQVVAIITSTGYASADFTTWGGGAVIVFFTLMFIGGSAGSTAGGVKVVRHLIIAKNSIIEFKRQLHLSAIIPVRFNGTPVPHEITRNILAFVIIYLTIFGISAVVLTISGIDPITSIGAAAAAIGNVGPGIGEVGPSLNYAAIPAFAKWILGVLMVVGRLEIFTVLIIFTGYFWRST